MHNKSGRYRRNQAYVFHVRAEADKKEAYSAACASMRRSNRNKTPLTAGALRHMAEHKGQDSSEFNTNLDAGLGHITGSMAWFAKRNRWIIAMCETFGPPTWYVVNKLF